MLRGFICILSYWDVGKWRFGWIWVLLLVHSRSIFYELGLFFDMNC